MMDNLFLGNPVLVGSAFCNYKSLEAINHPHGVFAINLADRLARKMGFGASGDQGAEELDGFIFSQEDIPS